MVRPKPAMEHTHNTPKPGLAGYWWRTHTNTHTPTLQPGVPGAAKTRTQPHTPTLHTPARIGGVPAERANKHTQPYTPATNGGVKAKPKPRNTHDTPQPGLAGYRQSAHSSTHTPTPQPGLAGCKQKLHPDTHTAQHSQDWRNTGRARQQTHTPQHLSQDRRSDSKPEPNYTHHKSEP